MQWHQLDHMQTICTSIQRDDHTNTPSLNFYRPDALPNAQQCQSTEGNSTEDILSNFRRYGISTSHFSTGRKLPILHSLHSIVTTVTSNKYQLSLIDPRDKMVL